MTVNNYSTKVFIIKILYLGFFSGLFSRVLAGFCFSEQLDFIKVGLEYLLHSVKNSKIKIATMSVHVISISAGLWPSLIL